jgi:F-type H+-transporting ATPase subunit gamma
MAKQSIQDIKRRIKSVTSTERITNSMKLVSAGKLRKARRLFEETNENSFFITNTIQELFNSSADIPKKYLESSRNKDRAVYIIITSNKGLCGGFNTNVLKQAQERIDSEENAPYIIAIGGKGFDFFQKRGYEIYNSYLAPPENITFLEAEELTRPIIELYDKGEINKVVLIYTAFMNAIEQKVVKRTLLPFHIEKDPDAGYTVSQLTEYEPSVEVVFNYLVPKYVEMQLFASVIESATCEHAARRMAMENATDNAREMLGMLNLNYNRARQAAITDQIIEIVAGSEAQN